MYYYFGGPTLRKRKEITPNPPTSSVSKRVGRKPRELVPSTGLAPITSENIPVGGESGRSVDNELVTMIFGRAMFNKHYSGYTQEDVEEQFWFIPFKNAENNPEDPDEIDPNDGIRIPNNELVEDLNIFKVTIRPHKFTTQNQLPVLAVNYGGKLYKIKWAPKPGGADSPPNYYIEVFRGPGLRMKKIWGVMGIMGEEPQQGGPSGSSGPSGMSQFGKRSNSEIRYLKKFV